ncbi:hypothetical protein [Kutzneria sp. CA-103260]|uniref:hypothetical protein n=1 Tax=Kutzneria sp. CA-103260 TaxID=2802641 RepID=UPI001BAC4276|nr:hypothetical protein [Kutzneria sp. CA-103260]QUQ66636.1 hypothetical protein JJ691_43640 [Kutzneria sp. CA-103260]
MPSTPVTVCAIVAAGLLVLAADGGPPFPAFQSEVDGLVTLVGRTGGFTVDPRDGQGPKAGYAVATGRATARIEPADRFFDGGGPAALRAYLEDKAEQLRDDPALLVGAWYDRPGRRVVLSLVELVPDRTDAISAGVAHRQRSIYDLATGAEVPTGYTGQR